MSNELEKSIVRRLCRHLNSEGFSITSVHDGEETIKTDKVEAAIDAVFAVDDFSTIRFQKEGFPIRGVLLVPGNGEDVIADYSFGVGDPDGFDATMTEFEANQ